MGTIKLFLVSGFLGYVFESLTRTSDSKRTWGRMFCGLPFLPIYGFGAVFSSENLLENILLVFIAEELGYRFLQLDPQIQNGSKTPWSYPADYVPICHSSIFSCLFFASLLTLFARSGLKQKIKAQKRDRKLLCDCVVCA